jgi:hypothetical protein
MLREDLHHPALGGYALVVGEGVDQAALVDLEHRPEPVRVRLVGAEQSEAPPVRRHQVPEQRAQGPRRLRHRGAAPLDRNGVTGDVRELERLQALPPVRVGGGPETLVALRRQRPQLADEASLAVEVILRAIAPHPAVEHL